MIMFLPLRDGQQLPAVPPNAQVYSPLLLTKCEPAGAMLEAQFGFLPRAAGFYFSHRPTDGYYDGLMDVGGEDAVRR
jgi:hypothetical protein